MCCGSTHGWNLAMRYSLLRGLYDNAFHLLSCMRRTGTPPDHFTYPPLLKHAVASFSLTPQLHASILTLGLLHNLHTANALVSAYAKYGCLQSSLRLFEEMPHRNTVTWNSAITACLHNSHPHRAMWYFSHMTMSSLSKPDRMTVTTILSAQGCLQMVARGREVHAYILRQGLIHQNQNQNGLTIQLIENALIDMYAKSSDVESAKRVFECMAARDLASWTAMISGLMQNGLPALALRIFHSMLKEGITPDDSVSIASVLPAITGAGTLQQGREIHGYTIRNGLKNPFVATALLDMYSKFGCITLSEILFHELLFHERNKNKSSSVVSWSAMIMAYAKHGYTDDALNLFHRMVEETRIKPNHKTLMAILTACSHGGGGSDLVDEAKKWFQCMRDKYQVSPDMYHYAAMVHLLGRAGQLEEAMAFIREMPIEPGPAVWGALLGSCRLHHDVELGERVAQVLSNVEPDNPGNYVLLSNMLAERGRWEDVVKVRELMRDTGLQKKPGFSFVDV